MKKVFNDKTIEWASTTLLIVGVVLTSYNIFPINVWLSLIGNAGWIIVGVMWRKVSLIIVSTFISMIYLSGIIKYYLV
jgi:hypothetical protein